MPQETLRFERVEKKYPIDLRAMEALERVMAAHLVPDPWGASTIANVYYDTDDLALVRRSLAKPAYKEKLRVRAYGATGPQDTVFVELKKKFRGVVYKRRLRTGEAEAAAWLGGGARPASLRPGDRQVAAEVERFLTDVPASPAMTVSYERHGLVDPEGSDLRVTFDENIRWRRHRLRLSEGSDGRPVLDEGAVLMEIKAAGAMPLWLSRALAHVGARPGSFSKYGACCKALAAENPGLLYGPCPQSPLPNVLTYSRPAHTKEALCPIC